MKWNHALLALSCWILASGGPASAAPADRLALMDVFDLEYATEPAISPDGGRVAYVRNFMDVMKDRRRSEIWIVNADGSDHRRLTGAGARASSPQWSPDGSKLLYLSDESGTTQIHLRWMDTGQTAQLTQVLHSPRGIRWSPDGEWIAFSMLVPEDEPHLVRLPPKPEGAEWAEPPKLIDRLRNRADGSGYLEHGYYHLFVLPVSGGTPRQVTSGPYHHRSAPVWAPDGRALIVSANRNETWEHEVRNSEIYEVDLEDGSIRALTDRKGPDQSPAVSPDGSQITYVGFEDRVQTYQVSQLHVMDRDGSRKRVLTLDLDRDVSDPIWDAEGRGIYFQYDDRGNTKVAHVNLDGEVRILAEDLGGTSLGRPYGGGSFSVGSNGRFAFTRSTPEHPADVAVGSAAGGEVRRITRLNEDLFSHKRLASVEEIWFDSAHDGRKIQGWIATPPDFDPSRKYPLILEIHGGPVSNYGDRFSAEVQLYAAADYVVFYANPRGSTSYGEEFGNLIHHNYPGEDYDDLMSGVDAVIGRGFIDEENLFATGGSAGGIMTAWIVGKTDRFRAAVAAKPVINWYSKVLVADNYYAYHDYRFPGSPWENPEIYMKFSPISLVGNVATPTLLMTGDADLRTPLSEAEQFYHALKLRRIDTALVRIPGASHDIVARPSQMMAKVAHVLAWFEKYRKRPTVTNDGDRS